MVKNILLKWENSSEKRKIITEILAGSRLMYICCAGPEPFTNERFGMRTVHLYLSYIQTDRKKNEGLNGFWGKKMRIGEVVFLCKRDCV